MAFGPRNLIEAIANGKHGGAVDRQFSARTSKLEPEVRVLDPTRSPTRSYTHARRTTRSSRGEAPPTTVDSNRRTGISEVETGLLRSGGAAAGRAVPACHIQTIYDAEKCVLCNRCVDICPEYCLKLVPLEQLDWDEETTARVTDFYGADGVVEPLSAMIKDDEKCIRCGSVRDALPDRRHDDGGFLL